MKITNILKMVLLTAAAFPLIAGCSLKHASLPGTMTPQEVELQALTRSEYEILETAGGEGCASSVLLFFTFTEPETAEGSIVYARSTGRFKGIIPGILPDTEKTARQIATYKAIEGIPGADALLAPRYRDSRTYFPLLYNKVCSTVKGKAIRIKTDKEIKK